MIGWIIKQSYYVSRLYQEIISHLEYIVLFDVDLPVALCDIFRHTDMYTIEKNSVMHTLQIMQCFDIILNNLLNSLDIAQYCPSCITIIEVLPLNLDKRETNDSSFFLLIDFVSFYLKWHYA